MSPQPQHGTPEGDATIAIRALARSGGNDVQELQTLYVLEALLARIDASAYRDDFVLKGGVLLAAFAMRRPTKDIDVQASRLGNDVDEVAARIREIAQIDLPDGVRFDLGTISAAVVRDAAEYASIRVKLAGALGRARVPIRVDVNFGDPISPAPERIELPRVVDIGLKPVHVLGYPLTMVLAEKIVTAIDRGETNTRWRDYADVYTIIGRHSVDANALTESIGEVAAHRRVELRALLPGLVQMPDIAQGKWVAWRSRVRREHDLPEAFTEVLVVVAAFADPLIERTADDTRWTPAQGIWS